LGLSGGILAALPMPLGSESTLGFAGPNGTPDIGELPAPAEPAGGVNWANACAGANRKSVAKRTSAELQDIPVAPKALHPTIRQGARSLACRWFRFLPCRYLLPSSSGVGIGERIRPNQAAITF